MAKFVKCMDENLYQFIGILVGDIVLPVENIKNEIPVSDLLITHNDDNCCFPGSALGTQGANMVDEFVHHWGYGKSGWNHLETGVLGA